MVSSLFFYTLFQLAMCSMCFYNFHLTFTKRWWWLDRLAIRQWCFGYQKISTTCKFFLFLRTCICLNSQRQKMIVWVYFVSVTKIYPPTHWHPYDAKRGENRYMTDPLYINPLQPGVAFQYLLKTSENLRFSDVFRGYRKTTSGCNGLMPMWTFTWWRICSSCR